MTEEDEKTTIYIGNLPETVTKEDLYAYFWTFGEIRSIEIPRDHLTRIIIFNLERLRGFAFVEFDEREDASAAIDNYDKSEFLTRTIRVRRARPLDQKPNYHQAVWANDDWMQRIEQQKIETENLTRDQEEKNRGLGLPIFKEVQPK